MTIVFHVGKGSKDRGWPEWTATGGGHGYWSQDGEWTGFYVDITCAGVDEFGREEHFQLQGDGEAMKKLFITAFRIVEANEKICRERRIGANKAKEADARDRTGA